MVSVNRLCLKGPSGECWSDYYFGLREDIGCVFGVSDGGGQKRQIKNQEGGERQKEIYAWVERFNVQGSGLMNPNRLNPKELRLHRGGK